MESQSLEQRRFYRHPLTKPIQYQAYQARSADRTSTVDVSEGGMCFLAGQPLAKGTKLHLKIPVGDQVFELQAQVAYCNQDDRVSMFRTGVAFLDAESAFRAKLAEEMIQINVYREKVSRELGREVSEEEAAREWIEKYAKNFSYLF
ncbi:MAG: PilZ domain-containing protein [Candidatus Omnitrophota bacterium]|jgi:c-di-GMP-binding flagellar brake protein YcgR